MDASSQPPSQLPPPPYGAVFISPFTTPPPQQQTMKNNNKDSSWSYARSVACDFCHAKFDVLPSETETIHKCETRTECCQACCEYWTIKYSRRVQVMTKCKHCERVLDITKRSDRVNACCCQSCDGECTCFICMIPWCSCKTFV